MVGVPRNVNGTFILSTDIEFECENWNLSLNVQCTCIFQFVWKLEIRQGLLTDFNAFKA